MTTIARTYSNDTDRVRLATNDGARTIGPLEGMGCPHGLSYQFRYEWPRGAGGPNDGEIVVIENKCIDCALQLWLRPGTRRRV